MGNKRPAFSGLRRLSSPGTGILSPTALGCNETTSTNTATNAEAGAATRAGATAAAGG
jgi:hypothetical protein